MENFNDFLAWEKASKDTIDFKKVYVDVAEDLIAGLLLSQIIYWHLPSKDGRSKLRVYKNDKLWLAKQRSDWWDEIRITSRQYDRAIGKLEKKGIVEVWNTMFNAKNTPHIHLNSDRLLELMNKQIEATNTDKSTVLPNGKNGFTQSVTTITETTTKNTSSKGILKNSTHKGVLPVGENPMQFFEFVKKYPQEIPDENVIPAVEYYLEAYERIFRNNHPSLKASQWQRVIDNILHVELEFNQEEDISLDQLIKIVDKHFITDYKDCDYSILHFISPGVMKNRFYEECYGKYDE